MAGQANSLENIVERTEFGHIINQNRKPIIIAGIFIVICAVAFSFYKSQQEKANEVIASQVYTFEKNELKALKDKKIDAAEFVTKFQALPNNVLTSPAILPTLIDSVKTLRNEEKFLQAKDLLESVYPHLSSSSYSFHFVATYLAVTYEDLRSWDQAIEVYEKLISSPIKILEAKIYLDLGRLYLKVKNTDKAKINFQYIVEKYPNDEMAKIAKLYLRDLETK